MRLPSLPRITVLGLLALVAAGAGGCARESPRLTVHAAASLSGVLPRIAEGWRESSGHDVTFAFGPSSRLAKQIEAGAPGDAYFSADAAWMDYVADRGRLLAGTRTDLLGNELVLIVPRNSSFVPDAPAELHAAARQPRRLALAGEGVPAGRYARAALEKAGVLAALRPKVTSADDVRMALAWVAREEADAGVVYATDAASEPRVKVAFRFPDDAHPPIVYPAAVLKGAAHPAAARAFLEHCQSEEARAIFAAAGFRVLETQAP